MSVRQKKCEGWVLVGTDGHIYGTTFEYTRRNCARIPHAKGVTVKRATLTLDAPKPKPRKRSRT